MGFAAARVSTSPVIVKRCALSSLATRTSSSTTFYPQNTQKDTPTLPRPHIIFPKGRLGTFQGFLKAQQRRHEDKEIWNRLLILHKFGPHYDSAQSVLPYDPNREYWRSVASTTNIFEALQRLVADEHLVFQDHPLLPNAASLVIKDPTFAPAGPPTWLTMHLIANRVRTLRHAELALDLALNQLRSTPKSYRFPLILLAVHRLLVFRQTMYLTQHIDAILDVYTATPEFHYNELLAACTRLPKTDHSNLLLSKVLKKMKETNTPINKQVASRLAIHATAYPEVAALLPETLTTSRAWGHAFRPHYHVAPSLKGLIHRNRASRMAKVSMVEALQALTPGKQGNTLLRLDSHEWSALITSVGRDPNVGASELVAFWDRVRTYRGKSMDIASQTAIMDAFRQRGQHEYALLIWKSILQTPGSVDKRALSSAVMALCSAARYSEAFDTMDAFAFKNYLPQEDDPTWPTSRAQMIEQRGRIKLDTVIVNGLMDRLNRGGRPDVVFKLWDVMEKYYCVWPDGITMTILLDAARRAYLIDPTMELALGQLGIFNPFKNLWSKRQLPETPSAAISKMLELPPESGFWHGDWAFINARVIFRDAVLGNWPHLQDVTCPVGTYSQQSTVDRLWVNKDRSPELRWPTIIPFDRTFHAYIFLLGWNELQAEIPLALAWMRALQIEPMHKTLCAALMYFGEVARLPPMFESFELQRGQEYGGDYGKLRRWIADWVGESALPSENMVAAYRRGDGQTRMRWHGRKY